jgi:uncharacterized protein YbjT (DUF2867 family)
MYVITGITGKVGGVVARTLLSEGQTVRAVLRDPAKAAAWQALGCEVAIAHMEDAQALTEAFKGAAGVFILPPSEFDPAPGFAEARAVIDAVTQAITAAQPQKVVCISTIGAQATQSNLLTQRTLMEEALRALPVPVTFLRPGWFMENAAFDLASVLEHGVVHSFLQPLDKTVPMIATDDVGRCAANLLQQQWQGERVIELEGQQVSPNDIARTFAEILGKPVRVEAVPRDGWEALFRSQGAQNPLPRARMIDGFNEGWICFEGDEVQRARGEIRLETVLRGVVGDAKI